MKKALIAIFIAVAIFVCEQVITKYWFKPRTPPPPPPSAIVVDGQVLDNNRQLLQNVTVRLHIQNVDEAQESDSQGRFKFSVEGFKPTDVGTVSAEAPGYKRASLNL